MGNLLSRPRERQIEDELAEDASLRRQLEYESSTWGQRARSVALAIALLWTARRLYALVRIRFGDRIAHLLLGFWRMVNANQFLQALMIPSLMGTAVWSLSSLWRQIYARVRLFLYSSVTISSKDENFKPIVDYVSRICAENNTLLVAETKKQKEDRKAWRRQWQGIGDRKPPELAYRPTKSGAVANFTFKGHSIMMWRRQGQTITTGWDRRPLELETLTLATWAGNVHVLKDILQCALQDSFAIATDETKIFVLSDSWLGGWEKALTKKPRPQESIVLDGDIAERLLEDARTFLNSSQWYAERGIPYRRGYLLHGPPGCGKTSFCQVLAGKLKLDMCMLSLSNASLDDAKLAQNFREAPESSIVLLEDVDAVFVDRDVKKTKGAKGTGVSFSGLLNAIDGVASQEGRLFFMTTNFPEKLDAALVRPGRCDVKIELKKASRTQMRRLFLRFFAGEEALADRFAAQLPEYEISMAQLQGHLLEYRTSAEAAVDAVPTLLRQTKPQQVKRMTVYEHLRRVGLERLTPLLEMHGYKYKSELVGLEASTVREWDTELQYDFLQFDRLKRLLSEETRIMEQDYPLASISTIRDAFIRAYPVTHMTWSEDAAAPESKSGSSDPGAPPRLLRQTSFEQHRSRSETLDPELPLSSPMRRRAQSIEAALDTMAKRFVEKLSRDGRGNVSLWQLRRLLTQNAAPENAEKNAGALSQPRSDESRTVRHMTSFEWLKRACCLSSYHNIKKAFPLARDLRQLKSVDKVKMRFMISKRRATELLLLLQNKPEHRNLTCGLLLPDRSTVRRMFRLRWPDCSTSQLDAFSYGVTDAHGRGLCSRLQLQNYLKDKKTPQQAVEDMAAGLIEVPEPPLPKEKPAQRDSTWIYKMLKAKDSELTSCAAKFSDAGLRSRDDILSEPQLTMKQLEEAVGIKSLGHRRRLLWIFKRISAGEPDGVIKVDDPVCTSFGPGKVADHREDDDFYVVKLAWGAQLYTLEENSGLQLVKTPVAEDPPAPASGSGESKSDDHESQTPVPYQPNEVGLATALHDRRSSWGVSPSSF